MSIGTSLVLIAVGAILKYALTDNPIHGLDEQTVGTILMVIGILGLVISLIYMFAWGNRHRDDVVADDRTRRL